MVRVHLVFLTHQAYLVLLGDQVVPSYPTLL